MMGKLARLVLVTVLSTVTLAAQRPAQAAWVWSLPAGFPPPAIPADNPMSEAKVDLGRHLFYDNRLSGNGTQSCAICHQQALAFTDGRPRSFGSTNQRHPRGSMSLVNVAYAGVLTWADPTQTRLEEQALVPIYGEHPVELGLDRSDRWLERFRRDPLYRTMFGAAFPGEETPLSRDNLLKALAAFQRAIVSARAPFDRYAFTGDAAAISEAAKRGEVLFHSGSLACDSCHGGVLFSSAMLTGRRAGSLDFHNTGLYNVAGATSYPAPNTGIYDVTRRPADIGKFKPPTLRNIAVTAPYMHDGSVRTLEEAIDHYAAGGRTIAAGPHQGVGRDNPNKSPLVRGFTLTPAQRADLIAFLESLTDTAILTDERFANPWPLERK